jgi:hypothetical protein
MKITSQNNIMLAIITVGVILTTASTSLTLVANAQDVPVIGGLCPEGHDCSCTPASGVFHDHTTGDNINTGCGGEIQLPSGQGLCEVGHECTCTNGVFHDLTTGISLANAC